MCLSSSQEHILCKFATLGRWLELSTEATRMKLSVVVCLLGFALRGGATGYMDPKAISYFDYLNPDFFGFEDERNTNEISRTIPRRKPVDSPIYYIRLPPQPYVFVPGLGYISQPPPPPSPLSQLVNLPISFVSNGKPSTIYQWGTQDSPGFKPTKPQRPESTVHKLPGEFSFNGKPDNMFILRNSYNALYGDALQNFYP